MIENLVLSPLQYVDGLPNDETQQRIKWIKNGDPLMGASTNLGNDGQLNAAGVCINKNLVTVDGNTGTTKDKVNEVITQVNKITDTLAIIDNEDSIKQIAENKQNIEVLQSSTDNMSTEISALQQAQTQTNNNIGNYDGTEDITRTVRGDLFWIKTEIGNYADQNINGEPLLGNPTSGVIARVMSNTDELVSQNKRISVLEQSAEDSDVSALTTKVDTMRTELGDSSLANGTTIYARLKASETAEANNASDIVTIKQDIDFANATPVATRVTKTETDISKLSDDINGSGGLDGRISDLETLTNGSTNENSLSKKITANADAITALNLSVGTSDDEGLRKEMIWVEGQLGSTSAGGTPTDNSILSRLNILTSDSNQNASAIQDIQSDLGNNNEGLKGTVNTLSTKMNGTGADSTIEGLGVFTFSKNLGVTVASKVDEALSDGKTYARRNKSWVALASSIMSVSSATQTVTLTTSDTPIALSGFTSSTLNVGVTSGDSFTVNYPGVYKLHLESEVASITSKVQFKVKVNTTDSVVLKRFAKDQFETFVFGTAEELVSLKAGDTVSLYVQALDSASAVSTVLNNIKLVLTPVF